LLLFSGFKGKTLWDWLSLAGVPLSLAVLGFWLQIQQQKQNDLQKQRELEQTEKLAAVEREQTEKLATIEQGIAEQNRQEEALENYFDKVSALLVEKNLLAIAAKLAKAEKDQETGEAPTESDTGDTTTPEERELLDISVDVIRARTLATLRRLDGNRKGSLIRFLTEAKVISKLSLSLKDADLSHANLHRADLSFAKLRHANLRGADLSGAKLGSADLYGAFLSDAVLVYAKLSGANLHGADLSGAKLGSADLTGTFMDEVNLSSANLNGAIGLTKEQLEGGEGPYLCRTQLPEGIDIDPNRDCEGLEIDVDPEPD